MAAWSSAKGQGIGTCSCAMFHPDSTVRGGSNSTPPADIRPVALCSWRPQHAVLVVLSH